MRRMTVQLLYATLPPPVGLFAAHYWFNVIEDGRCDRWEVWQTRNAGGISHGHLHCNLKAPEAGVGGGPVRVAGEWHGAEAARLKEILVKAKELYPHCHRYLPWPGPNSNTFAAWVLRRAAIEYALPWKAIGRNFACPDA
jgi:hypothetical protein